MATIAIIGICPPSGVGSFHHLHHDPENNAG
jgi:hypothetical protein